MSGAVGNENEKFVIGAEDIIAAAIIQKIHKSTDEEMKFRIGGNA